MSQNEHKQSCCDMPFFGRGVWSSLLVQERIHACKISNKKERKKSYGTPPGVGILFVVRCCWSIFLAYSISILSSYDRSFLGELAFREGWEVVDEWPELGLM